MNVTGPALPRLGAQLDGAAALDAGGVCELKLSNIGVLADVYRLRVCAESGEPATVEPSIVRLESGAGEVVSVTSPASVTVRVYSQVSGQRVAEVQVDAYVGVSSSNVTGPSLTELTRMSAPKIPLSTRAPRRARASQKAS